jgi:hypothetical protein
VHLGMQPGMVYEYPLWGVGLLLVGLAAVGAVFLDLAARQFLSLEFRRRQNDVAAAIFSVNRSDLRGTPGIRGHARLGTLQQGEGR